MLGFMGFLPFPSFPCSSGQSHPLGLMLINCNDSEYISSSHRNGIRIHWSPQVFPCPCQTSFGRSGSIVVQKKDGLMFCCNFSKKVTKYTCFHYVSFRMCFCGSPCAYSLDSIRLVDIDSSEMRVCSHLVFPIPAPPSLTGCCSTPTLLLIC